MPVYTSSVTLPVPVDKVFAFYTDLHNLARMALPELNMRVVRAQLPLRKGSHVQFGLRPGMFPFEVKWEAVISAFEVNLVFEDRQIHGPFDRWRHRHEFKALENGHTLVTDTIDFGAPMGLFGRLAASMFVGARIEHSFRHRERVLRRAFGHG